MKILFIRHGESCDDIDNQYGGWSDFPLTQKGEEQILARVPEIQELGVNFEMIYTSPLVRAKRSAEVIAKALSLPVEVMEYAKERNSYGILSGMKKEEATAKYPDQVEKLNKDEYVDGSERAEDLVERIKKAMIILEESRKAAVIVVTHGAFLKYMFPTMMNVKLTKKEDGGWILTKLENGVMTPEKGSGISWR